MGYDYVELPMNAFSTLDKEEFNNVVGVIKRCPLRCEALNMFFPFGMKIVGATVDAGETREYIIRMMGRAKALGAAIVVIGSGGARSVPSGEDPSRILSQFSDIVRFMGDEAERANMTMVLEPLNKKETNMVNSISEGAELVRALGHPRVALLADFYHMRMNCESLDRISEGGGILKHAHIANGDGRAYPSERAEDKYDEFFSNLKLINYGGMLSVEADPKGFASGASKSLALMRKIALDHGL